MSENDQEKSLTKSSGNVPKEIHLGQTTSIDLSFLSESDRKALILQYTQGIIDISKKANELNVETKALEQTLHFLSSATREASQGGNAVTLTHTQTSSVGRTEVIMGNTEQAHSGKLSKSQTGEKDWTPYYIFGGILALILIASLLR